MATGLAQKIIRILRLRGNRMKKSPIRRPLQHLIRAEKHIAARVYLSNMIERLLDNHDDQLDYTYKHAR